MTIFGAGPYLASTLFLRSDCQAHFPSIFTSKNDIKMGECLKCEPPFLGHFFVSALALAPNDTPKPIWHRFLLPKDLPETFPEALNQRSGAQIQPKTARFANSSPGPSPGRPDPADSNAHVQIQLKMHRPHPLNQGHSDPAQNKVSQRRIHEFLQRKNT